MAGQEKMLQSTQVIAKIFGVTTRRVEQLKSEGVIQGEGRPTRYDALPTIQAYIKHLSDKANGRDKKQSDKKNESIKVESEARLKKAKAEIAEMQLKELKGELHRAEDVESIVTNHVLFFRAMLLSLPGRLAVDIAEISSAPEAANRVEIEVKAILQKLSDFEYNLEEYRKKTRERQGWDGQNEEE